MSTLKPDAKLSGRQKAAIVLVSLGRRAGAEVFRHLKDDEIEELTLEIAGLGPISAELKQRTIQEFYETAVAQNYITEGGLAYARGVLEEALGADKANKVLDRLSQSIQVSPFEFLRRTDASQILNAVANEHPQTVALILAYIPSETAGQVISSLPDDIQSEVAMRLALMDRTAPEVIHEIESVLERKLSSVINQDFTTAGGVKALVEVLGAVDRGTERTILESLEEQSPDLADEVRRLMFLFEDIVMLDDRSIQQVLREVDGKDLAVALKGTSDTVQEKILKNMSSRAAEIIKEDLEFMGPVRVSQVEEAQQKIVGVIRKLEEAGTIVVSRGGDDDLVA
ncbi:MAG: flagellar motor switch protein FliG [Actinobacteria bacterium]|nr:flagellar motor switch protein FliG [Thermoleophilia bacterium]MCB9010655.1 flagellar motor switch protein FliG [Actinomycetota bacterium]